MMEWHEFIERLGNGEIIVDGLSTKRLSRAEINALLAIHPNEDGSISFEKASKEENKTSSTLKTQLQSIYNKLGIEGGIQELSKLLRKGFHAAQAPRIPIIDELPTSDELWSRLKGLGRYAPDRMGIYEKKVDILNMGGAFQEEDLPKLFLDTVIKGTENLKFKVLSKERGKILLLLNYDEAGNIWCVCPSIHTPSIELNRGEMIVPQLEAPKLFLPRPRMVGKEQWWAWIVSEEPPLSWFEQMRNNRGEKLSNRQLLELLRLAEVKNGEVLHTYYWVVENNF
jgi:hypothetical protein